MLSWLFNVYMDGEFMKVDASVLGRGFELFGANGWHDS